MTKNAIKTIEDYYAVDPIHKFLETSKATFVWTWDPDSDRARMNLIADFVSPTETKDILRMHFIGVQGFRL